jgi:MFS family permease
MLPLGLFRRPSFTGIQLASFALSASVFALFLYTSLYLQDYLGYSPFQAGLRYLPITVVTFLVAPVAAGLLTRVPARALLGFGLATAGAGLLLMSGVSAGSEWTTLLGGFVVLGVGGGLLNPVIGDVALSVVPKERSGMAAGIMDTFRQVGVSVGVAVWGAVFVARGADKVSALTAGTSAASGDHPRQLVEAASSGDLGQAVAGLPPHSHDVVVNAAREGFLAGFNEVLMLGGLLCFVGAALALWLVREHEIEREPVDSVDPRGQRAEAPA